MKSQHTPEGATSTARELHAAREPRATQELHAADARRLVEQLTSDVRHLTAERDALRVKLDAICRCPTCNGLGSLWYAGYRVDTCNECHGTGKRR